MKETIKFNEFTRNIQTEHREATLYQPFPLQISKQTLKTLQLFNSTNVDTLQPQSQPITTLADNIIVDIPRECDPETVFTDGP